MWGRGPRLQHYGAAGDVNRHAGVLDEEVLQRAALEADGPESRALCSKTGGRGNKPALVHQGGCGRRAARGGRGGPRTGWSRVAVYEAWEGSHTGEGVQRGVTHTHTHTGHKGAGREKASLVRPSALPIALQGHPQARSLDLLP